MNARYVVAAAVLASFAFIPAFAGPNPADEQKIAACVEASVTKGTSGVECIGIIADPCIAEASKKDSYREDSKTCAARELAVWTGRIQRDLQGIKSHGKAVVAAVTSAQKSFADSLAKLCPVYDKLDPGMSLGGSVYCRMQERAVRALTIGRLARAGSPH